LLKYFLGSLLFIGNENFDYLFIYENFDYLFIYSLCNHDGEEIFISFLISYYKDSMSGHVQFLDSRTSCV